MNCEFNPNKCSATCNKYSVCIFYSIQNQISELQSQINFIYKTISDILNRNEDSNLKIKLLEDAFYKYICTDSESIKKL
jgi:peptidoglycan hydrolase CwlO-like protein